MNEMNLNGRQLRVANGFLRLSEPEQNVVLEYIETYRRTQAYERGEMRKALTRRASIDLGPLSSGACPCCGR